MRKIRTYGEPILRKKAEEVKDIDDKTLKLINSMKETLLKAQGIGLAGPQVGVSKRIFITYDKEKENFITLINPVILEKNGYEIDIEGCLSFPEIFFSINRAKKVIVKGINEKGKEIIVEANGIIARCFQHEIDHLNGILIIDYATQNEKNFYKEKLEHLLQKSKK
ncbi:MAG: peptide deformylase [Candidatus Omnitrophica bacterium]|nr:peptide deformylase [Candidatus Omnitrophota bacterium]